MSSKVAEVKQQISKETVMDSEGPPKEVKIWIRKVEEAPVVVNSEFPVEDMLPHRQPHVRKQMNLIRCIKGKMPFLMCRGSKMSIKQFFRGKETC